MSDKTKPVTLEQKIDALAIMLQELLEQQQEIIEKLGDLGINNSGFSTFAVDDD